LSDELLTPCAEALPLALEVHATPSATEPAGVPGSGKSASASSLHPGEDKRWCSVRKTDGSRCRTYRLTGRTTCRMHSAATDPALAQQLAIERSRAGRAPRVLAELGIPPAELGTPEGVRSLLERVADEVIRGRLTASQAAAVSQLANSALRAAEVALDGRLAAIEAELERERGGGL
jgi:hypothetical protein